MDNSIKDALAAALAGFDLGFQQENKNPSEVKNCYHELQNVFEDNYRQAEIQMQSLDAKYNVVQAASNCCPLTAGHKFELFNHSIKSSDGQYLLTQVTHYAVQTPDLTNDQMVVGEAYHNNFSCVSLKKGSTPFRPVRKTPKAKISGSQTAVVVGPSGEEIFKR